MKPHKAVAQVDALVTAIGPDLELPDTERLSAILVTGPWLAGVTGVITALSERLPDQSFIEAADLQTGQVPSAVVFVVSAAAALTGSDCALLDAASAGTDAVIGVVSKTDVHQNWAEVMSANRATLAAHAPRYRDVPWVGVAAAPEQGEPQVDDLVEAVTQCLAADDLARRNRLREWDSRLNLLADRYDRDADGAGRRARTEVLREQRSEILRQRRLAKSERGVALRGQVQAARVQLGHFARNQCSTVRAQLQEDAAQTGRAQLGEFGTTAATRLTDVVAEVNEATTTQLTELAQTLELAVDLPAPAALPVVDVGSPPLKSRTLETRLMMLVGAGFGLGVALTLSRLLAGLSPGLTIAGAVVCAAIGLALTVSVVRMRGLLRDRALLDRWTGEAAASVQSAAEQLVATRVVAAESALTAALNEQDEAEGAHVAEQISVIDTELREHAVVGARAAAVRGQQLPTLRAALAAIRAELGEPEPERPEETAASDADPDTEDTSDPVDSDAEDHFGEGADEPRPGDDSDTDTADSTN